MKKHNGFKQLASVAAILLLLTTNASAKQQSILLDANGKPLSNEILQLLSTSSDKIKSLRKPQKHTTQKSFEKASKPLKKQSRKANKKRFVVNPILEQELLADMKAGRVARVDQLLRAGIRPTYKNYEGETPLGIAVTRGWASMVVSLLKHGADINEKGTRGVTLLHTASARGLTDVAKVLVKNGLNPSQKTDKNWTPLHVAARYGRWQLVQYFIAAGVDPDIRNSDGKTALGLARHLRHQGVIKMLSRVTRVRSLDISSRKKRKIKKQRKSRKKK